MKCCIIQTETHPDKCIEEVFGPYDSWKDADDAAVKMEADPSNFRGHNKMFYFAPHYMTKPE